MNNKIDDDVFDMYGDDDTGDFQPKQGHVGIKYNGKLTEIEIENKKVTVVDHNMVQNIDSIVRAMQKKISFLEQEVLNLKSRLQRAERNLVSMKADLDTKIGYE
jgi:hypothetical protein